MKEINKYTLWLSLMALCLVILCMAGGYFERGYFAFDSSFVILILSPIAITYWYKSEKEKYYYHKSTRGGKDV